MSIKNGSLNKAGTLIFAVALFAGVFLLAGPAGAQEEDMGITVSCAPEQGRNPDAATGRSSWIPFAVGGVAILAGGIFMVRRKAGNKISGAQEPASKSRLEESKPQPAPSPAAVVQPPPVAARTQLQFVRPTPPPIRQVFPESRPPIAEKPAPVLQPETPREPVPPVSPVISTVSVPVVKAPAVVVPVPKPEAEHAPNPQERNNDEEDMLFKHLDLLKQLRNKESQ
jgi:hypothetical protein